MTRKRTIAAILLIALAVATAATLTDNARCTNPPNQSERIYVHAGITDNVQNGTNLEQLIVNTEFDFDNISGPPVNLTLPAMQYLEKLSFQNVPWGGGYEVSLLLYYYKNFSLSEAEDANLELRTEFIRLFNYTSLQFLGGSGPDEASNETVVFRYDYGYLPISGEGMTTFFLYKPEDGFASLLDGYADLYSSYILNGILRMMMASYDLVRTDVGDGFYWEFTVMGVSEETLRTYDENTNKWLITGSLGERAFDVNQLINNTDSPIVAGNQSTIEVSVDNNTSTYAISIESVVPEGFLFESYPQWDSVCYTWSLDPNETLEDVVLNVNLYMVQQADGGPFDTRILGVLIVAAALVVASTLTLVYWSRQRRKNSAEIEDTHTKNEASSS